MKKRLFLLVMVVVVLGTLMIPGISLAYSNQDIDKDIKLAQEAGTDWMTEVIEADFEIPNWRGAELKNPQVFFNLNGDINAYMFSVSNEGKSVGHALVGSAAYGYPVFQAGEASPPALPSGEEIKAALEELGLTAKGKIDQPLELLYLGPDSLYALYEVGQQKIGVNLVYKNAVQFSDLKPLISPSEYNSIRRILAETKPITTRGDSGSGSLDNMYYWKGTGRYRCGPCSGVSIGAYYRDEWSYSFDANNEDMYDALYITMETTGAGITWPDEYGPGFDEYAQDCGYNNFGDYDADQNITAADYWPIVADIDVLMPTAIVTASIIIWPPFSDGHWRAIKGYFYTDSDDSDTFQVCCTNSATEDSWEMLDWSCVISGIYCATVSIEGD